MRRKRKTRREKKRQRFTAINAVVVVVFCLVIGWQALSGLIRGDWLDAENYYGQPIDPALQLILLGVVLVVGVSADWQYLFKKDKKTNENKKRRREPQCRVRGAEVRS